MGDTGIRWLAQYIENLPIPFPKDNGLNSIDLEKETDHYIYTAYNLSDEEIIQIDSQ